MLEFDVPENEWQHFFITPQEPAPPDAARRDPGLGEDFDALGTAEAPADESTGEPAGTDGALAPAGEAREPAGSLEAETADTATWKAFLREAEGDAALEPEEDQDDQPLFVVGDDGRRGDRVHVMLRRQPDPTAATALSGGAEPAAVVPLTAAAEPALSADVTYSGDAGPADHAAAEELAEPRQESADARRPAHADTVLDWGPPPFFPERTAGVPVHAGRWLAASLLAALILAGQAAHYFRDRLAGDPGYGALVRAAYARLGLPLNPGWPLDAYEIRGAKAIAENSAPGALDIVAEIAVTGPEPVGLPMVRVVLRDRWSNAVASGLFDSTSYLAETAPPSRMYAPGTLIPVQISLQDPGSAAQGYELDVCIPNRQLGLQCKAARDPFRR
jgi:hypothetical protein